MSRERSAAEDFIESLDSVDKVRERKSWFKQIKLRVLIEILAAGLIALLFGLLMTALYVPDSRSGLIVYANFTLVCWLLLRGVLWYDEATERRKKQREAEEAKLRDQ